MTEPISTPVTIVISAIDPPFEREHGVLFGLQSKHGVDDPLPASESAEFRVQIEVRSSSEGLDFVGDHVHGRRGDRFIYLSWGVADATDPFVMFARTKIKLAHIPYDLIELSVEQRRPLRAELQATNARGQPATGTINAPAIRWKPS